MYGTEYSLVSSFAAALLEGLFEHPADILIRSADSVFKPFTRAGRRPFVYR